MPDLETVAAEAAAAAEEGKLIHLVDPGHISLTFGADPQTSIQFGPKGGFEDGHWRGPRDHPLIPALLSKHPNIVEYGADTKSVYTCSECEATFGTAAGSRAHYRKQHTPQVVK